MGLCGFMAFLFFTDGALGSPCDRDLVRYDILKDGFAIVEVPPFHAPTEGFAGFFRKTEAREARIWSADSAVARLPEARSLAEWGERVLSAQLGLSARWVELVLIREPQGYRGNHLHTDPAMATLIVELEGPATEGTYVASAEHVVVGSYFRYWATHLVARRASRTTSRWAGDLVRVW